LVLFALALCVVTTTSSTKENRFIFYDVNPGEGFNLRRDVFMRVAVLVKHLNSISKKFTYTLVLPPWGRLYHWQSRDLSKPQVRIPWSDFFDVSSIARFIPVQDLVDHLSLTKGDELAIDQVFYLQHYKEGWGEKYEEKHDFRDCIDDNMDRYYRQQYGELGRFWEGYFWGHGDVITANQVRCLSAQGSATSLASLIEETPGQRLMLDRAETVLHDNFGGIEYWEARRSMRFAHKLVGIANQFRKDNLDSDDVRDNTVLADSWEDHRPERSWERGGPYACVHLRRKDFVHSRSNQIPSLKGAARQLVKKLGKHKLNKLYVATDAPANEYKQLSDHIGSLKEGVSVHRFVPDLETKEDLKDGGVAIVDQIICSHAKYFVGSFESTFSFRIQEEREIMGFQTKVTFDMMCADSSEDDNCEKGSKWKIVYPPPPASKKSTKEASKDEL